MSAIHRRILIFASLLAITALAACGAAPAEPTVNPDTIYTAAAMTVEAQLTQAAAQNPSPTFTEAPPTATMTATLETQAAVQDQTAQANQPGQPVQSSTTLVLSSFTPSPPPPTAGKAKYELVGQDPADGSVVAPEYRFDMSWTIKNTGTETWTEQYSIEFFIGDRIGGGFYTTNRYNFKKPVKPGETITIIVDMKTPSKGGEYYSWWKLKDNNGNNFGDVDVTLVVPGAPTVTSTP